MDPKLLEYYNQELTFMREISGEFSRRHPKIARRLGMQGIEVADPYVERLIEAFCLLSARTQIKLDAEFPRFSQRLLEVIYPNYVAPTPSMAVARLEPAFDEADFSRGFVMPRGSALLTQVPAGEKTACEFRTGQPVTLWPLEIAEARLTGVPPDIPGLERYLPPHAQVRGALRLRLRIRGKWNFADLQGLDDLPFYLCGDERIASHLMELIHTGALATLTGVPGKLGDSPAVVNRDAVTQVGMSLEECLLPVRWNTFHGHNLLHEYFACPSRFYFFGLRGLAPGLRRIHGKEVEIVLLLDRPPGHLAEHVDADQFALFCTPIINLFPKRTDRVEVRPGLTEYHLVPDRGRPLDFEVFSIDALYGQRASTTAETVFRPLFQTLNDDEGNYGRYFSVRRERRLLSGTARKYGTRTPYVGTEVFLSLVDQNEAPFAEDIHYLSVQAWTTNRDLPLLAPRNGRDDLRIPDSAPVRACGLIRPPSAPRAPLADGEIAWRLIRQLALSHVPLTDLDTRQGGQAIRDLLRLFVAADDRPQLQQIAGIVGSRTQPITCRLPGNGPLVYGRGVQVELTVDEEHFSGISPYLLGLVLERYVARHVSVNVFTRTELKSMQRGTLARWSPRPGTRGAA
ncbi:type VI secretion system baseplate subunit TssF [Azonexus sp.]|jgi:type VI secretion system protein ImpG|uniref:type VI secretion system baseplate subunit TssF n=1 Tax=Azonexus sp. TaxID=1872668 RepID=UPI0028195503|nr:type VI secretion system baseplate subunit TssF [Azonexus sp.]MDR1994164.1 type VI secretion system baseplate subunit TssF [Azonexus sp.]